MGEKKHPLAFMKSLYDKDSSDTELGHSGLTSCFNVEKVLHVKKQQIVYRVLLEICILS